MRVAEYRIAPNFYNVIATVDIQAILLKDCSYPHDERLAAEIAETIRGWAVREVRWNWKKEQPNDPS